MLELRVASSRDWLLVVLADMDAFLLDHAACERKASATAMSLIAHYPDKPELVCSMLELAFEELEHFKQVYEILSERGLVMSPDEKDAYVNGLRAEIRRGSERYFLDRLLVNGIIEARGCERFGLVHLALEEGELKDFYKTITASEARHQDLFVRLAGIYFDEKEVQPRLDELLDREAAIVGGLPLRPVVH